MDDSVHGLLDAEHREERARRNDDPTAEPARWDLSPADGPVPRAPADAEDARGRLDRWDGNEDAASLVARADRALYQAKDAGRDRSVVAASIP